MFGETPKRFPVRTKCAWLFAVCAIVFMGLAPALGQKPDGQPPFSDFKGVRIGTPVDEARKKLGGPKDKSAEEDFFIINDNQSVQVFYDKAGTVNAISINFMSGATGIPTCKEVLGDEAAAKSDGSMYKLNRYPKAGYWVSYSRTAGDSPLISVTMQRIEH